MPHVKFYIALSSKKYYYISAGVLQCKYNKSEGRGDMFELPELKQIAKKHGKTVAQVILRWHLQRGIVVIPKSTHNERMEENFNVFDFTLDEEDMSAIAALDKNESSFFSHTDPAMVEWFVKMVEERKKQHDCTKDKKNW